MKLDDVDLKNLYRKAKEYREKVVEITYKCGGAHIGGSMSIGDVLMALYFKYLNYDAGNPEKEDRDRFVLSKGHAGVGHAVALSMAGFFEYDLLYNFNKTGSPFGMHLDKNKVKGVDASTGSLGHGIGMSLGMALSARMQKKDYRIYCMLGDGESNEGSVWEAAMAGGHFKLANLTVFVDSNAFMIDGPTEEVMGLEPLADKWKAFRWNVLEINGHDYNEICGAIETAQATKDKPTVIICRTKKGFGVDFMSGERAWHYGGLDDGMAEKAQQAIHEFYKDLI